MKFLNVSLLGLSGAPHIALKNINTTQDTKKLRLHLKVLSGDLLTGERLALQDGTSPSCKLCHAPVETTQHILTECAGTADIHQRLLPELLNTVLQVQPSSHILVDQSIHLTQFILDCTSINLPEIIRIPAHNPKVCEVFRISRDWCYSVITERSRLLKGAVQ